MEIKYIILIGILFISGCVQDLDSSIIDMATDPKVCDQIVCNQTGSEIIYETKTEYVYKTNFTCVAEMAYLKIGKVSEYCSLGIDKRTIDYKRASEACSGYGSCEEITIRGHSMSPTIMDSSKILIYRRLREIDKNNLKKCEVITFHNPSGRKTTHRIVEIGEDEEGIFYRTKGDNNHLIDNFKTRPNDVYGLVVSILII